MSRSGVSVSSVLRNGEREHSSPRGDLRWKRKQRDLVLFGGALFVFGLILYFLTRPPSMGG